MLIFRVKTLKAKQNVKDICDTSVVNKDENRLEEDSGAVTETQAGAGTDTVDGLLKSKSGVLHINKSPLQKAKSLNVEALSYKELSPETRRRLLDSGSHHVAITKTKSADIRPSLSRSPALPVIRSASRGLSPEKLKKAASLDSEVEEKKEKITRKVSADSIHKYRPHTTCKSEAALDKLKSTTISPESVTSGHTNVSPTSSNDSSPTKTPKLGRRVSKIRETLPAERDYFEACKTNKDSVDVPEYSPKDANTDFVKAVEVLAPDLNRSEGDSLSSSGVASMPEATDLNSCTSDEGVLTKEHSTEELEPEKDYEIAHMSEGYVLSFRFSLFLNDWESLVLDF